MRELLRDLQFGARLFGKSPIFAITAVLLLATGISANTLIFSVVNSLLLRRLNQQPTADRRVAMNRLAMLTAAFLCASLGFAQQEQSIPPSGTSTDRLFYTLPNFLTLEDAGHVPPLTTAEKFKVVAKGSFDLVEFPWYGLLSGISQAENSEAPYGQGTAGYAKRYATAFADGTLESFMTSAVFPTFLKEDPRFYQSSKGSFGHRFGYAVSRIFVTRTDSGREEFNYSEIFGSAVAAGISTYSYHPRDERTVLNSASVWGSQVGYDTIAIVIKEFWPDIRKKLNQKFHHQSSEQN